MAHVGVLVADSGAFIKAASLEKWSKNVVTIKEVVSEIKDSDTRRRLQVLPYDLSFKEPSQIALRHVTDFAKKTGDYQSLSTVDLQLVALTYQLELELERGREKGANLRSEPLRNVRVHQLLYEDRYFINFCNYLEQYTLHYNLSRFIQFGRLVEQVSLLRTPESCAENKRCVGAFEKGVSWRLTSRDLSTGERTSEDFDAVLVCNGHYFKPHSPEIEGMNNFTGKILHSHLYKEPALFSGQCVLVVGAGQSGRDIMLDLAPIANTVCLSNRGAPLCCELPKNIECVPEIERIESDGRISFKNGCTKHFDAILLCTGYEFEFPFLKEDSGLVVEPNSVGPNRVCTLYKHTFNYVHPSMAVIGINISPPFPCFDLQVQWILAVWSGEKTLPSKDEMIQDTEQRYQKRLLDGLPPHKASHFLGEVQWDFYNELADLGGNARLPPVVKMLYMECSRRRTTDLMYYKETEFEVISNTDWVCVHKKFKCTH